MRHLVATILAAVAVPRVRDAPEASLIPLCAGTTILTAVSSPEGDYESIRTVVDAGERGIRLAYSAPGPTEYGSLCNWTVGRTSTARQAVRSRSPGWDSLQYRRREYPLNCRGGGGLAFDTLGRPSDSSGAVALSLTFTASPLASGPQGQGLRPGTCAWVDRPVNNAEPSQVWFTTSIGDSILQLTVRDSSQYWGFLAFNSDSGHLSGVGHRHWDAASPPMPVGPSPASLPPERLRRLLFVRQHLLQLVLALVLGWVAFAWGPLMVLLGLWSGWRRLARLYPSHEVGRGTSFRTGILIMGMTNYRGGARLTADPSYLRFSMSVILRPGHPPFSVPWSDVTLTRDEWPWFPFKGKPVTRVSLARHPGLRILVPPSTGERIVAASEGRVHLEDPREPAIATT